MEKSINLKHNETYVNSGLPVGAVEYDKFILAPLSPDVHNVVLLSC